MNIGSGVLCKSEAKLSGKVVIVTGSTGGIGIETARDLAKREAVVIMAVRNLEKAKPILEEIKASTGNTNVYAMKLDLCSLQSVVEFAKEFKTKENRLDILVNNAGIYFQPRQMTADGFEQSWQANYLGHFLLTVLLLDVLKQSAPSRIVNVSSVAYAGVKTIDFDDINGEKRFEALDAYCQSKLAQVLSTHKLSKLLQGTGVSVFSLHPGLVKGDGFNGDLPFFSKAGFTLFFAKRVVKCVGLTVVQGAQTSIHCAVTEGLEEQSGGYFYNCKKTKTKPWAEDDALADKLWDFSNEQVKRFVNV